MQPHELIRAAARIIQTGGWCHAEPGDGQVAVHARDHAGAAVSLFSVGSEGTSRAAVNPHAVSFSIYGALVKAQAIAGQTTLFPGLMWDTLYKMGLDASGTPHGGTNYVHPVIQYNETEGRTQAEVLAFLERCAEDIEAKMPAALSIDSPPPPPIPFQDPEPAPVVRVALERVEVPMLARLKAETPLSTGILVGDPEPIGTGLMIPQLPAPGVQGHGIVGQIGFPKTNVSSPLPELEPGRKKFLPNPFGGDQ